MVEIIRITYEEIRNNIYTNSFLDPYGIVFGFLTNSVKNALLANPNLEDDSEIALNVIVSNNKAVGRNVIMPTKVLIEGEVYLAHTGGSYEIIENERGNGYGSQIFKESIIEESNIYIGQYYSSGAISILRKMNLPELEVPQFIKICRSRSILEARGVHGNLLKISSSIIDFFIWLNDAKIRRKIKKLKKKYDIRKESIIPKWIDDMVLNDKSQFMEIHDRNWMQWCLDYNFSENIDDIQSYYSIYDKCDQPKGFFMIKVRHEKNQGIYKSVTKGSIVEWGTNTNNLNEADINMLACSFFDKDIDNITTITSFTDSIRKLKKCGFIQHGNYQMNVKVESNCNIIDSNLWRIRYGGCNTIII